MDNFLNIRTLVPRTNLALNSNLGAACFQTEVTIYNFTHVPITATHRNGLAYELVPTTPQHMEHRNAVVIKHTLTTTRSVIKRMASKLNAPSHLLSHAQRYLIEEHANGGRVAPYAPCNVSYEHIVYWNELQSGEDFYIADSDICLTTKDITQSGPHPYSLAALAQHEPIDDTVLKVKVIDNTESRSRVFMPYHQHVIAIDVKRDENLTSGVYVEHMAKAYDKDGNSLRRSTYLTLEEAESGKGQFSIFHTKAAAYAALRINANDELLIHKLKHDSELAKSKAELEKAEAAYREIQLKVKHLQLEREESIRKERAKEKYESRSSFRKELLEVMKLAAPGIALVQLIIKLRTGS